MKESAKQMTGILFMIVVLVSCNKEEQESYQPLVFKSLTASSSILEPGQFTAITADAEGTNVTYFWVQTEGTISGSGSSVTYSCDFPGNHTVICTVRDAAGNVEDKQLVMRIQ